MKNWQIPNISSRPLFDAASWPQPGKKLICVIFDLSFHEVKIFNLLLLQIHQGFLFLSFISVCIFVKHDTSSLLFFLICTKND